MTAAPAALVAHLAAWVGAWPPRRPGLTVLGSPLRLQPGWDGTARRLLGVVTPEGDGLLTVQPALHADVAALLDGRGADALDDPRLRVEVGELVGGPGHQLGAGTMRWTTSVDVDLEPLGTWLDIDDPRVPPWLHPFGGRVLVALEDDVYVGGAGLKRHGPTGWEIAVGTEPSHRGHGVARRLTATAARHALASVPVVAYHHDQANRASGRVADAVGLHDLGWLVVGVFGSEDP